MRTENKNKVGRWIDTKQKSYKITLERKKFLNNLLKKYSDISNTPSIIATRLEITRILYYNTIYQNLLGKPGVIMEFGVEWGSTLSLLCKLRGIYEPYNNSRKIIGFDTFSGFNKDLIKQEKNKGWKKGDYRVDKGYEKDLEELLKFDEKLSPVSYIKKFELVKGDASKTIKKYLSLNPQTIIGMAIFDMDVYKPTLEVLKSIKERLYKGSILVFDELNRPEFPGETMALLDSVGLNNLELNSFHGETSGCWAILK